VIRVVTPASDVRTMTMSRQPRPKMGEDVQDVDTSGDADSRAGGERSGHTGRQGSLLEFFTPVTREESSRRTRQEYRAQERRRKKNRRQGGARRPAQRAKQHKQDRTMGVTTQNVRGWQLT
jgi:hypothetical protein